MKIHQLDIIYNENTLFFHKGIGALLGRDKENKKKQKLPEIVNNNYQKVRRPFLIKDPNHSKISKPAINKWATLYAKLMVFTCKYSFVFAKMLTYIPFVRFETTVEAISSFKIIYPSSLNQRTLCLPRAFFALATSKSFKKNGTAFIGVFLPSRKMHAWIIENDTNPDPYDDVWICYKPVAALTRN